MSDTHIRTLERRAAAGDPQARRALLAARMRAGPAMCSRCGGEGGVSWTTKNWCCCNACWAESAGLGRTPDRPVCGDCPRDQDDE